MSTLNELLPHGWHILGLIFGISLVYISTIAFYRAFFHPLSKFPGPKLAALTSWYECYYDIVKGGQFVWEIGRMHEKYGPIVRVNPNEIHINDPKFYDEIYAPSSKRRNKYEPAVNIDGTGGHLFATVSHDLHRLRASALSSFFSKQSIIKIEPMIIDKFERLCQYLESCIGSQKIITFNEAAIGVTTEIISSYGYGESYKCLDTDTLGGEWKESLSAANDETLILKHFGWIYPLFMMLPESWVEILNPSARLLLKWQNHINQQVVEVCTEYKKGTLNPRTIFYAILVSNLPEEEKQPWRLSSEARNLLHAGAETPAIILEIIIFHLLDDPKKLERLRAELRTVMHQPHSTAVAWSVLESLPYLTAIVKEGIRLQHGLTTRSPRVAPTETLHYKDWEIPPGTPVSMITWFVHTNTDIFPEPLAFKPERWLEASETGFRLDKYMTSFGKGSRQCIGKNLAYAGITIGLATLVRRFDFELYKSSIEDVSIVRDAFSGYPKVGSRGVRVKVVGICKE